MIGSPEFVFKTFERVLVRKTDIGPGAYWNPNVYLYSSEGMHRFLDGRSIPASHCEVIAYEGNECLTGTCNRPAVKWEPKPGDLVAVSDSGNEWLAQVFVKYEKGREEGEYITSDVHDCTQPSSWQYCEPIRKHFNVPEE